MGAHISEEPVISDLCRITSLDLVSDGTTDTSKHACYFCIVVLIILNTPMKEFHEVYKCGVIGLLVGHYPSIIVGHGHLIFQIS